MAIQLSGSLAITGSLTATSQIVAQTLNVQQVTSSIVYSSGSNIFGNSVSNTQQFTGSLQVSGSNHHLLGDVGLGTTSDLARVTILADSSAQSIGLIGRSADNISTIRWWNNAGNSVYTAIESNANYTIYNTVTNGYASFHTNNTERLRVTSGGDIGVGTSSPFGTAANRTVLSVNGTTDVSLNIGSGGSQRAYLYGSSSYAELGTIGSLPLTFAPNNTERMRITSGGNVGIGTTSPTYILDVFNSTEANLRVKTSSTSGLAGLYIGNGNRDYSIITRNSVSNVLEFRNETANTTVMAISGSNVGIGTTSPSTILHLVQSSGPTIRLVRSSNRFDITGDTDFMELNARDTSTYMIFKTADTERIRITSGGLVGVGTTNPIGSSTERTIELAGGSNNSTFYVTKSSTGIRSILGASDNGTIVGAQSNHNVTIVTNDTTRILVSSGGNVGIGTTNPGYKFHVQGTDIGGVFDGTSTAGSGFVSSYNSADGNAMQMRSYGSTTGATIFGNSSNKMNAIWSNGDTLYAIGTIGATPLILGTSNTERVRITSGGNVGIGTTNPTRRLYVTATSGEIARFDGSGFAADSAAEIDVLGPQSNGQLNIGIGGSTFVDSTNNIQNKGFITAGTGLTGLNLRSDAGFVQITAGGVAASNEVARFTATGNVGIGVTSPGAKLSVNLDNFPSDGGTIARFTGGTTTPTTERFVEIFQSYTGAAFDSPMLVFRSNTNASNNSSYGIIRGTADGAIVLSNVNNTSAGVSAASEKIRITSGGDVGIGTSAPTTQTNYRFLQVNGTNSAIIETMVGGTRIGGFDSDANTLYVGSIGNFPIGFRTAVDEKMRIAANGNVGIGTTSPSARFQVTGSSTVVNFQGSGSNIFTVDGTSGRLFSVDDDLTNSLFSVNTIAGLPVIEAFADNTVRLGRYSAVSGSTMMVTGSAVAIGTTTVSTEANLYLGAQSTSEGGQLILQRGTSFASASHLDNYENQFRIMSGTDTISSTVRMSVNMATGIVTTPFQPAFRAGRSSSYSPGGGTILVFNSTSGFGFNIGGYYNTSNGRFTAPVNGVYNFTACVIWESVPDGQQMDDAFEIRVNGSTAAYSFRRAEYVAGTTGNSGFFTDNATVLLNLTAGQYVEVYNRFNLTIHGNQNYCYFSGYLVG